MVCKCIFALLQQKKKPNRIRSKLFANLYSYLRAKPLASPDWKEKPKVVGDCLKTVDTLVTCATMIFQHDKVFFKRIDWSEGAVFICVENNLPLSTYIV